MTSAKVTRSAAKVQSLALLLSACAERVILGGDSCRSASAAALGNSSGRNPSLTPGITPGTRLMPFKAAESYSSGRITTESVNQVQATPAGLPGYVALSLSLGLAPTDA
jgi:hypothetical protein